VSWVLTGGLLCGTVCTPLVGRLADVRDKRPILLTVLLIVCASTLLSALSTTIFWLAVGQILQGVGLGLVPLGLGIVRDTQAESLVRKASGLLVAVAAGSVAVGLLLTGLIVPKLHYSWVFWIPLAMLVVITVVAWRVVPSCPPGTTGKVDWTGAGVLGGGLLSLLLGVSFAPSWGWTSPGFLLLEAFAVLMLIGFVVIERRTPHPLLDLTVGGRAVVAACGMTFAVGFATTATFVIIPMIVAAPTSTGYGLGATPDVTGMILVPGTILGVISASLVTRLEAAAGARGVMVLAGLALLGSAAVLPLAGGSQPMLLTSSVLIGIGIGAGMTQSMNIVLATVPHDRVASVGGLAYVMRSVGGTIGGQIAGSMLAADFIPGTGLASWSAFSLAMWTVSGVVVVVIALALTLPARSAVARQPA
jgi:MFS family permease